MRQGLFLTPGAARTAYQVGAVQALVEAGVHFDVIGASSVGALNGAFVATGQTDRLVELWSTWTDADIFGIDVGELVRGGVWWARNLGHNRPQRRNVIEPYLEERCVVPGVRFRINLANCTTGDAPVLEWPDGPVPLADGVNASVAVPVAVAPAELMGDQWVDGLTVDGFPLESTLLATGVERAFVVGVAPRRPSGKPAADAARAALRAAEWNQYSETLLGLERAEAVNDVVRAWEAEREAVRAAVEEVLAGSADEEQVVAAVDEVYAEHHLPYGRRSVELVAILPDEEIEMFFVRYEPERSARLIELGRRDARRVLEGLDDW